METRWQSVKVLEHLSSWIKVLRTTKLIGTNLCKVDWINKKSDLHPRNVSTRSLIQEKVLEHRVGSKFPSLFIHTVMRRGRNVIEGGRQLTLPADIPFKS